MKGPNKRRAAKSPGRNSRREEPTQEEAVREARAYGSKDRPSEDVFTLVTKQITAALEAGTIPWKKPWAAQGGLPRNLANRRFYRGMNVLLLALGQPYTSPWWLTYKQAKDLGGYVRKGEHASLVTFWKLRERPEEESGEGDAPPAEGPERKRPPPIIRHYHVFNLEQCEGIEAPPQPGFQPKEHEALAACEAILAGMPQRPALRQDPRSAYYSPGEDIVAIPDLRQFETAEGYYATLFHELVHSTGHPSRLARPFLEPLAPFGSPDYSKEELVAEFGATFLCAQAGIFPSTVENQASYIQGWLAVLKGDTRLLPVAAGQAQRAADFIGRIDLVHREDAEPVEGASATRPSPPPAPRF